LVLGQTLLALAATLLAAWLLGALAVRLRQPRVGGEMVGGLLVGTALLSPWREEGSASEQRAVLSPEAVDAFNTAGQVGVILYLFLVGLSLDPAGVRRKARTALLVSLPVILAAVALAPLGAYWFDSGRWELSTGLLAASLIMAAALMINGFPVVAHMLQERGELRGDLASTVLGAAALLTVVVFTALLLAVALPSGLVAKRVARFSAPEAKTIAALLNCRGLLLLVLAVAMADEDLIGPSLVAVLFLGALATTLMTGPLLGWAQRSTGERTITV
jgi:Kef-type K+ transport system membrane component KefB